MTSPAEAEDSKARIAAACGVDARLVRVGNPSHEHSHLDLRALEASCDGRTVRALVLGKVAMVSAILPGTLGPLLQEAPDRAIEPLRLARAIAWVYGPEARGVLHAGPDGEAASVVGPEEIAEADVTALARSMAVFPDATLVRSTTDEVELRFLTRWSAEVGGAGVARVGLRVSTDGRMSFDVRPVVSGAADKLPSDLSAFLVAVNDESSTVLARRVTYVFRWTDAGVADPPPWLSRLARGKRRLVERASGATRSLADKLALRGDDPTPVRAQSPTGGRYSIRWWLALTPRLESGEFSGQELWLVTLTVDGQHARLDAVPGVLP